MIRRCWATAAAAALREAPTVASDLIYLCSPHTHSHRGTKPSAGAARRPGLSASWRGYSVCFTRCRGTPCGVITGLSHDRRRRHAAGLGEPNYSDCLPSNPPSHATQVHVAVVSGHVSGTCGRTLSSETWGENVGNDLRIPQRPGSSLPS